MPKTEIDYSNTIIYKITCKDPKVTDVYVGHTTNFVQRKHAHKQSCINDKAHNYTCKLYDVIRNNGGWQNWHMEIIKFFNCHDHYEARQKEQEFFVLLNATLNSVEPMPKPKPKKEIFIKNKIVSPVLYCNKCNITCETMQKFEQHNKTNKHLRAPQSAPYKFNCQPCDFKCCKKNEWARHIATRKHQHATKYNEIAPKQYNCDCGKTYNHRASLYNHKKKCKSIPTVEDNIVLDNNITLTQSVLYNKDNTMIDHNALTLMVVELIKSNQELQKQMLEVCKVSTSTTNNNNNNNNHNNNNKTFNMQFFLNEQCKDAMNIMEFVDTFKLDFSDLEKVGEVGYVEGMSNIIIKKLNEMDIYKRPIHCSDAKRETTFVKDKNVWEKENGTHDRLRLAIRHISKKNTDMLLSWCDAHPGACDSDNYLNDIYIEMVRQAMGGRDLVENENKIMRKIGLSCLIDKQHF